MKLRQGPVQLVARSGWRVSWCTVVWDWALLRASRPITPSLARVRVRDSQKWPWRSLLR